MSVQAHRSAPHFSPAVRPWLVPGGMLAAALVAVLLLKPDFGLIAETSLAIKIHLVTAVAAFFLGVAMLTSRKGRRFHRIAGWAWTGLILTVALSSLFITQIRNGSSSWIHILSGMTLLLVPLAVAAARRHDVKRHRSLMTGVFFGGMIIAGGFTFLPGRLMWEMFFGH